MNDPKIDVSGRKPTYARGEKYPAWLLIALPFVALLKLFWKHAKDVNIRALFFVVLLFEVTLLIIEHNSVMLGHWVYNTNRILGLEIWDIPIEEPLIYYFFPPIMVVLLYQVVFQWLRKRSGK